MCCLLLIFALHIDVDPTVYRLFGMLWNAFIILKSQRSTNPGRHVAVATKVLYGDT